MKAIYINNHRGIKIFKMFGVDGFTHVGVFDNNNEGQGDYTLFFVDKIDGEYVCLLPSQATQGVFDFAGGFRKGSESDLILRKAYKENERDVEVLNNPLAQMSKFFGVFAGEMLAQHPETFEVSQLIADTFKK